MMRYGNVRLERFWEHSDDSCELNNIGRVIRIQGEIVLISAYVIN